MRSRRDVLGALGMAAVASAAGCQSLLASGGTDTEPSAYDWLGPAMANVQWLRSPDRDNDSFNTLSVQSPAAAAANEHFEWSGEDEPLHLPIHGREIALDVDPPELYITDPTHQFSIYSGSFDADTVSGKFADATSHDEYRDHEVVTEAISPDLRPGIPDEADQAFRGAGFNDRNLVIAHVTPSESRAVEFVHAMLDTEAGAADRFVETDEEFAIVADEIGEGWRTLLHRVGPDYDTDAGASVTLDGDTATRRGIAFYETEAEAADSWLLDEERLQSMRESSEDDSGNGHDVRTEENMFEPYTELDTRREGRYVVLEGTLPTTEVSPIDYRAP